jgi:oxaloacetate decarboxylase gamma subunit
MTIVEMLGQSGVLTLLGMGVVFGFLVLMIICISLVGRIIRAAGAGGDAAPANSAGSASGAGANNGALTAAIGAAVNEYQKTH